MSLFSELDSLRKLLSEAGKIELYDKIYEILQENLDLQNQIRGLKQNISELENKLKIKESLIFENNMYFFIRGNIKEGPFCSCCWDKDNKLIRLHKLTNSAGDFFICPNCKITLPLY